MAGSASAQSQGNPSSQLPDSPGATRQQDPPTVTGSTTSTTTVTGPSTSTTSVTGSTSTNEGKQTKRILFIFPNFRSVSVDEKLPPQSAKDKFWQATQDSFDYSSLIFDGALAGISQAENSVPEFGQGMEGYGRYYWRTFLDQSDENFWVEGLLPVALHQDSRYYTLGKGGVLKRTEYAVTRIVVTRTDHGGETFNASEVVGAGAAAGLSNAYYPVAERTWTKTGQRWALNVGLDGATFLLREFWPNINSAIFHQKD